MMVEVAIILARIQIAILALIILLALVYSIPILIIHRFHNVNNLFTVNVCLAVICCAVYYLSYTTASQIDSQSLFTGEICAVLNYFQMMCTIQVPLALIAVSIHRLCSVVYHTKVFFRKQRWVIICIASQWTAGILLVLPPTIINNSVRISDKNEKCL
jgi:hypothetical protein